MKKIVLLTSRSLRHQFFISQFARDRRFELIGVFQEGELASRAPTVLPSIKEDILKFHFGLRDVVEADFFSDFTAEETKGTSVLKANEINDESWVKKIHQLSPDLILTFGCSIIRPPLLALFPRRIINVHLGLSPYYRGSGTNFHAMADAEFQCVGATFMYMDEGIDTGEIIHQRRATIFEYDNPHTIGNRLVKEMVFDFRELIAGFEKISPLPQIKSNFSRLYRRKDATPEKTRMLYEALRVDSIGEYLKVRGQKEKGFPILVQEFLR